MDFLGHLWMPIVLATVICFILSALIWMLGTHHKGEWREAPNVGGLRQLLRAANVQPGAYTFPHMSDADRKDKERSAQKMKEWAEGPSGVLYVVPAGPMNMGTMMGKQFVFFLLINVFLAYIGWHAGLNGQPYLKVFQVIGAVAFMTYGLGSIPESIWFGRPWKSQWLTTFDALIYACFTAGTFGWLWNR